MTYSIEFIPEAAADYKSLDGSVKKKVNKKLEELSKNPFLGEYLGNKFNIDLPAGRCFKRQIFITDKFFLL